MSGASPSSLRFTLPVPLPSHYVKIHAVVTENSPLKVKMFKDLDHAAAWLGVPRSVLEE